MDGGRLVPPTDEPARDEEFTTFPEDVKQFRRILNTYKKAVWDKTAEPAQQDPQDLRHFDQAYATIRQFGNILMVLLSHPDAQNTRDLEESMDQLRLVLDFFRREGFEFEQLSNKSRDLCKYYVQNDVYMLPYDLDVGHINSITHK